MINPIAAISAAAMLLEHSRATQAAAARVMQAIQTVTGTKMKSQAAGKMGYNDPGSRRPGGRRTSRAVSGPGVSPATPTMSCPLQTLANR